MYDIITFGSAAQDINVKSKDFKVLKGQEDFITGEGICLNLGSKIDVEDIFMTIGGSGVNTASTFAKQGFKTAICCAIGVDMSGLEIVRDLKNSRIDTRFVVKKKEARTTTSVIISMPNTDRTILISIGASGLFGEKDIQWKKIKGSRWFYLAPLKDSFCDCFEKLVDFAKENNIKVACNPSKQQLSLPEEKLKNILSKVDILFLNQEEASFVTKIPFIEEQNIFKKIGQLGAGVAVMTKGGDGVVASDGKYLYSAKVNPNRKIVDTTGAGDSFSSGFLSDYIRNNGDIEKAIQLGLANSEANLSEIGAKSGLLEKNSKFERAKVLKQNL
ncbi:MAG: carbohydrate kinase family protein [Candidatus Staskawiczbacteria bacterium]|nr:carbohydrate kinase family protein [Candidatus Staskawiczbacteria bacterium]